MILHGLYSVESVCTCMYSGMVLNTGSVQNNYYCIYDYYSETEIKIESAINCFCKYMYQHSIYK